MLKPGFHYTANATTTTQKQSDYKVEQSSFTLIGLFSLEVCRCLGRNWLNGNRASLVVQRKIRLWKVRGKSTYFSGQFMLYSKTLRR